MEQEITPKFQKKLENIIVLKSELRKWKEKIEEEINVLLKAFEKTTRDEGDYCLIEQFTDSVFAEELVKITYKYSYNSKIVLSGITAIGMMWWRYDLPETKQIYQLMVAHCQQKGIAPYVAIYLPNMKHFAHFENKWEYYMSMKTMTPTYLGRRKFLEFVEKNINIIPLEYKDEIIMFLEEERDNQFVMENRGDFQKLIDKIKS